MPERQAAKSSLVLFQRDAGSGGNGGAMWDDSELIAAWNRQLDKSKALEADPTPLVPQTDEEEEEENSSSAGEEKSTDDAILEAVNAADGLMPPMPAGANARLKSMLQAWFAAGVQTGYYLAEEQQEAKRLRKRQREN